MCEANINQRNIACRRYSRSARAMHKRINIRARCARARAQLSPRTVQWLIKADRAIPLKLETVSPILRRSRITEIFTKDAGSPAEMRCDKDGPCETRRFRRRETATANFANLCCSILRMSRAIIDTYRYPSLPHLSLRVHFRLIMS